MSSEKIMVVRAGDYTILNVDDYPAGRYATTRILRQAGFHVEEAATGMEALARAGEIPDLIVLDVNLPDIDGFEVARRIKADPATASIPVLHMSAAYRSAEHRAQGLEEGADAYLAQPVEPRELVATVRALLRVRQVEEQVRRSEERFRSLVAASADVVWTTDAEGGWVDEVPRWYALTGQAADEARGGGWLEAVHPDDREETMRSWKEAVAGRGTYDTEYRLRLADGSFRWFSARGVPVLETDGEVREWVGLLVDVDERRRAEMGVRLLAEAGTTLGTSLLDHPETLRRLAALVVPALADWCAVDILGPGGAPERMAELPARGEGAGGPGEEAAARVLRTGAPELVEEPGGGWRSCLAVPLATRGEVMGVLAMATDGSGRRLGAGDLALAEELARRAALAVDNARLYDTALVASQAKSDFLAVMSHELRTPMNAIIGYSDLLDAEVSGPLGEKQRAQLGRIRASSRHLLHLIDEVLTFSRIEAGAEEVHPEEVDLAELVRETATLVEPLSAGKGLAFRVEVPERPVAAFTDPGKVRQILLNLLSNAVKFTESGTVELAMRVRGEEAVLAVRDTGIGISPAQAEKVFDAFWQAEQTPTRRRTGGTGLGLSVTRRLARMLGGDVELHSEPERGSVFSVTLPLRVPGEGA